MVDLFQAMQHWSCIKKGRGLSSNDNHYSFLKNKGMTNKF